MSEHTEQAQLVLWFKMQYPQWNDCIWSNMNGAILCDLDSKKRAMRMSYLKKEGFKKGVSDLMIAVPRSGKAGLFIEMKDVGKTKSSVSADQKAHIKKMLEMGYHADWAAGFKEAQKIIKEYVEGKV